MLAESDPDVVVSLLLLLVVASSFREIPRRLSISSLRNPFVSRNAALRSVDASRIDSSSRNLVACSRRVGRGVVGVVLSSELCHDGAEAEDSAAVLFGCCQDGMDNGLDLVSTIVFSKSLRCGQTWRDERDEVKLEMNWKMEKDHVSSDLGCIKRYGTVTAVSSGYRRYTPPGRIGSPPNRGIDQEHIQRHGQNRNKAWIEIARIQRWYIYIYPDCESVGVNCLKGWRGVLYGPPRSKAK